MPTRSRGHVPGAGVEMRERTIVMDSPTVPAAAAAKTPRRLDWRLFLALVPCLAAFGFFLGSRLFPTTGVVGAESDTLEVRPPTGELPPDLFRRWGNAKPDLAIVLTGQTFGYLQPCGCSYPQFGGLTRRYNLIQMLKRKGWAVTAVDLGDLAPLEKEGLRLLDSQALEQFKTTLKAMSVMDYEVFGLGLLELKNANLPLFTALAEADGMKLAKPKPMTLNFDDPNAIFATLGVQQYAVLQHGGVKVGVTSIVGATLQEKLAGLPGVKFIANDRFLPVALKKFGAGAANFNVDVTIVFMHSDYSQPNPQAPPANAKAEAEKCAQFCDKLKKKNPASASVDLIVYASSDDVAPAQLQPVADPAAPGKWLAEPKLLLPGHKGKYVGVIGLFKQPTGGYDIKYELVNMSPDFDTPKGAEKKHPVMALLEDYSDTVKKMDFLSEYGQKYREEHPTQKALAGKIQAKFIGSEACSQCHAAEYEKWETTAHAVAYDGSPPKANPHYKGLVEAKDPGNRQFDPECIACHVTGFKYKTGFGDPPANAVGKQKEKHFEALKNVGCETCHGPGSMHANDPNNKAYWDLINPIKLGNDPRKLQLADNFCQKCHDIENDVNWGNGRFEKAWKEINHSGLGGRRAVAPGVNGIVPSGGITPKE
jgi:2',3'-cyclic-nucleotide 2'-phosphodiesterase (5'-nucleotidase family)